MEKSKALKALEDIGWGKYQKRLYLICGMAWFSFDAWLTNMTYTLEGIKEEWKVSNLFLGFIASSFQVGILCGNLAWGLISDKFGRKIPYRLSAWLAFIGSILLTFAYDQFMMIGGFFILGFGMAGQVDLSTTIICENCPPSKRYFLTLFSLFFSFGAILSSTIALIIELTNQSELPNWRLIIACLCFIQLGNCISRFWIDETPVFLFESKKVKEAEKILNEMSWFNKKQTFSFDNNELVLPNENQESNKECSDKKEETIKISSNNLLTEVNENQESSEQPKKIICKQLCRTIFFLAVSNIVGVFSYVGVFNFILQFLFFLPKIRAYILMIILQFTGIPGILLGTKLVDSPLGRRWTTALGLSLCGVFTFIFGLNQNFYYVIIITSLIYFNLYLGAAGFSTLAPESFPTNIRSTAHSCVSILGRLGGSLAPIVSGALISESNGTFILLCIYAICFFVAGIIVLPLRETRINKKVTNEER